MFLHHLFDASTPYRRLSAGTPETVGALTPGRRARLPGHALGSGTAHPIVAGPVEATTVVQAAERRLGDWAGGGPGHRTITPTRPAPAGW